MVKAKANWMVHYFWRPKGAFVRAGHYEYDLRENGDTFQIVLKKIFLHDDRVVGRSISTTLFTRHCHTCGATTSARSGMPAAAWSMAGSRSQVRSRPK